MAEYEIDHFSTLFNMEKNSLDRLIPVARSYVNILEDARMALASDNRNNFLCFMEYLMLCDTTKKLMNLLDAEIFSIDPFKKDDRE